MSREMKQLYQQHAQTVYRYLYSLCHQQELAEELTQETFYRALYSIERYDGTCKVSVWLCQIARHIWYQYVDKKKKYPAAEWTDTLADKALSPEEHLIQENQRDLLYQRIARLQTPMKEVVFLRVSEELSFADIGRILNKSENWARVTFYRAKTKLKEGL
ncbi:RNA polymerase sigma factor [Enterococcus olivae]